MSDIYRKNPLRRRTDGWADYPGRPARPHQHHSRGFAWLFLLLLIVTLAIAIYFAARGPT